MGQSVWEPDEERFINRLKTTPSERQIADIRRRCGEELKKAMQSFLYRGHTRLLQETIDNITNIIVKKYQQELDDRGFTYELKVTMTPNP